MTQHYDRNRYAGKALFCVGAPLDGQKRAVIRGNVMMVPPHAWSKPVGPVGETGAIKGGDFLEYQLREVEFRDGPRTAIWVLKGTPMDEALHAALRYLER